MMAGHQRRSAHEDAHRGRLGRRVQRQEPRGPRARQRRGRGRQDPPRGRAVRRRRRRHDLRPRQARFPGVHQHPRAHGRRRRRLPAARHGEERLSHGQLHELRRTAEGPEDAAVGQARLREAVDFVRKYDGSAQGRLRGMLNAAQVETCSEPLLRAGKDAARELNVPIHTHAGGNLVEFQRIMEEYRKTPVQFLADIGFLDERTLLGHVVFTTAHGWPRYPFGDDLRVLAQSGATVGHCPYKYAKMAMTLQSFQRYLEAGVSVAIGTDTYPMDMVAELRWASILAKVTDGNYQVGLPRDVFNAATLGGCKFLARTDLGRLAPGAKADLLLINLDHLGAPVYADPIKALVDAGCGRDVDTVIVDGKILVQGGRATRLDEAEVYAKAREVTERFWSNVPAWRWDGAPVDRIIPPAFPIHGA